MIKNPQQIIMDMNDIDWEGEWIILLAFGLQLAYSIWLVVEAWKGLHTKMEISTIVFQFAIQYFYVWYFVQQGMVYSAIGIGILSFAAVVAFIIAAYTRRRKTHDYHHKHKKCGKIPSNDISAHIMKDGAVVPPLAAFKYEQPLETPSKVHPASHPDYIRKQREHRSLFHNQVASEAMIAI